MLALLLFSKKFNYIERVNLFSRAIAPRLVADVVIVACNSTSMPLSVSISICLLKVKRFAAGSVSYTHLSRSFPYPYEF